MQRRAGIAMTAAALSVTVGMLVGAVLTIGNNARSDSLLLPTSAPYTAPSTELPIDSSIIDTTSQIEPMSSTPRSAPIEQPVPASSAPLPLSATSVRPPAGPAHRTTASGPTAKRTTAPPTPVVRIVYVPPQPTRTSGRTASVSTAPRPTAPTSTAPTSTAPTSTAPTSTAPTSSRTVSRVTVSSVTVSSVTVSSVTGSRVTGSRVTVSTAPAHVAVQTCDVLGQKRVTTAGYDVFCQRNFPEAGLAWRPVMEGGGCLNRTMKGIGVDGRNYWCRAAPSGLNHWKAGIS